MPALAEEDVELVVKIESFQFRCYLKELYGLKLCGEV
jgi:hypothetical protein